MLYLHILRYVNIWKTKIMDEKEFKKQIDEILSENGLVKSSSDINQKLSKSVGELSGAIDTLRISVKYLLFDLEATRRENQYLRKMLNEGK